MITLSYARRDKALAEKIEKILQDSSLAYQIEKRSDRKEISLKDGNLNIKGENETKGIQIEKSNFGTTALSCPAFLAKSTSQIRVSYTQG